ncbi:uncharacterized protein LOC144135520 [Amblyomma americanum]
MAAISGAAAVGCGPTAPPEDAKTADEDGTATWPRDDDAASKCRNRSYMEPDADKEPAEARHECSAVPGDVENEKISLYAFKVSWVLTMPGLSIIGVVLLACSLYRCYEPLVADAVGGATIMSLDSLVILAESVYFLLTRTVPLLLVLRFLLGLLWDICKRQRHPLVYRVISAGIIVLLILDKKAALETFSKQLRYWGTLLGRSAFLGCAVAFVQKIKVDD